MDKLFIMASIGLFLMAIKFHMLTQANVKVKIKKEWYDRIWTGSRPSKDNLTEEGLECRKKSNLYAIAGFVTLGIYVLLNSNPQ